MQTGRLALWPHMSFAKCGPTLTKRRHHRRTKKVSFSCKYEQEQRKRAFLPSWQRNRPWLKYLDAESGQASTPAAINSTMYRQICQEESKIDQNVREVKLLERSVFIASIKKI